MKKDKDHYDVNKMYYVSPFHTLLAFQPQPLPPLPLAITSKLSC